MASAWHIDLIITLNIQRAVLLGSARKQWAHEHQQHLCPLEMSFFAPGFYSLHCVNRKEQADKTIAWANPPVFKTCQAVSVYHLCATGEWRREEEEEGCKGQQCSGLNLWITMVHLSTPCEKRSSCWCQKNHILIGLCITCDRFCFGLQTSTR